MPRQTHKYRLHKATGRAFVSVKGERVYLGKYGSEESLIRYGAIVADLEAGIEVKPPLPGELAAQELSINELVERYLAQHVASHYVKHGKPTSEQSSIRYAVRPLCDLCGSLVVSEFGPKAFKLV